MDDVKIVLFDPGINDELAIWAEKKYGSDELGHMTLTSGKRHDYLGMTLDFSEKKALKVDMREYIRQLRDDFPGTLRQEMKPWGEKFFKVDENSEGLNKEKSEAFHSFVMKIMFLCKRGRPDV